MTARNRVSVIVVTVLGLLATFAVWLAFGASSTASTVPTPASTTVALPKARAGAVMVTSESHYGHILPRNKGGYYQQVDRQWWLCSPTGKQIKRVSADEIISELLNEADRDRKQFEREQNRPNGWPACLL